MAVSEFLQKFREKGYPKEEKGAGMDSGEENSTSRTIKLSDDEQKSFAQAQPGEDLACEVHGTLESDGHFHVMSVSPMGGGSSYGDQEKEMAGQVAQRVQPNIAPSPS